MSSPLTRVDQKKIALKILQYLKKAYPVVKTELNYRTEMQLVVAVMLSAQCTDKVVNRVTEKLFKKYKTAADFAKASQAQFQKEISSVTYYKNKAKHIREAAKLIVKNHDGEVPQSEHALVALPGIGYKTAHVILGELFEKWDGIPVDTHVKRFAQRFGLSKNSDLKKISKDLELLFPKKDWKYVNNGLVLYGRYTCKATPHDCRTHGLTKVTGIGAGALQKVRKT